MLLHIHDIQPFLSSVHFFRHDLHILMDDYFRPEERKIANDWTSYLEDLGYKVDMEEIEFDKNAMLLKIGKSQ